MFVLNLLCLLHVRSHVIIIFLGNKSKNLKWLISTVQEWTQFYHWNFTNIVLFCFFSEHYSCLVFCSGVSVGVHRKHTSFGQSAWECSAIWSIQKLRIWEPRRRHKVTMFVWDKIVNSYNFVTWTFWWGYSFEGTLSARFRPNIVYLYVPLPLGLSKTNSGTIIRRARIPVSVSLPTCANCFTQSKKLYLSELLFDFYGWHIIWKP